MQMAEGFKRNVAQNFFVFNQQDGRDRTQKKKGKPEKRNFNWIQTALQRARIGSCNFTNKILAKER